LSRFLRRPPERALALWLLPLGFVAAFFFTPLLQIFRTAGQASLGGAGGVTWLAVWRPLRFTLFQAGLSTLLTLLVGLPAAFVFGRFDFPAKRMLSALTTLPFILPVVTAAAGFNALLGPNGWLNLLLMRLLGLTTPPIHLLNTLAAILLGHVFYNTAIVIRMVGSAWAGLDPRLEQAARVLGASPLKALREVTLPLLRPAILAAALLVFLFDFTSFGVILLLGGPHFATLEVEIYIQALQMLNLPLAGVLLFVLDNRPVRTINLRNSRAVMVAGALAAVFFIASFVHIRVFSDRFSFWNNAVQTSPSHAYNYNTLGAMYFMEGDLEKASGLFSKALELNPGEFQANGNMGLVLMQQGRVHEAAAFYRKEIAVNPGYDNVYYNYGLLFYNQGKTDSALLMWEKTVEVNPRYVDAYQALIQVYRDLGRQADLERIGNQAMQQGLTK